MTMKTQTNNFIYDKSMIMKAAWEEAKRQSKLNSERKFFKFGQWMVDNEGVFVSAKDCLSIGLRVSWKNAKSAMVLALKKVAEKVGTYIELTWVADAKNANRSESFLCTGTMIDTNSLNPSFEGEQVCYVYA